MGGTLVQTVDAVSFSGAEAETNSSEVIEINKLLAPFCQP